MQIQTIKFPIIILGYGDFKSKKLFSYESKGNHMLPIFTNPSLAHKYKYQMAEILKEAFNDERGLSIRVCEDVKKAIDIFRIIAATNNDLYKVIIDPTPPHPTIEETRIYEDIRDIDDFIEQMEAIQMQKN